MSVIAQLLLAAVVIGAYCLICPPPLAEIRMLMGIRPNQRAPRPSLLPTGCRHESPPVPVEVHDRLDGRPEVVAWLCPDCYEETHAPPPPGRGSPSPLSGLSAQTAAESIRRALTKAAHANMPKPYGLAAEYGPTGGEKPLRFLRAIAAETACPCDCAHPHHSR